MDRGVAKGRIWQRLAGELLAGWLRLVHATSRFVEEPHGLAPAIPIETPYIVAMWHGQHFLVPFMNRGGQAYRILISRSADGEINAVAARRLGLDVIRGSGAPGRKQAKLLRKGGAAALRGLIDTLAAGINVGMTADVPRTGGIAGPGIVTLARLSGRPIVPVAVATSNFFRVGSWDRASINLPFSRGAFVIGTIITVPRDADEALQEEKRLAVETALDEAHRRAYALVGRQFQSSRR
ncbi:MAG: lysophospholipid acyltransferase family protein [Labrys sp. (in: a-proteobacteria)]|jgi:lysophospholipid acyltransferase (LPLAT)-like uncharacterized protein